MDLEPSAPGITPTPAPPHKGEGDWRARAPTPVSSLAPGWRWTPYADDPLPLVGRGKGWGYATLQIVRMGLDLPRSIADGGRTPTPYPSPQGGWVRRRRIAGGGRPARQNGPNEGVFR